MDNPEVTTSSGQLEDKKEHIYDILAVTSRIMLGVFAFGILFYFISSTISWRIDVTTAKKEVTVVNLMLNHYTDRPYNDTDLKKIENKINDTLIKYKLPLIDISSFLYKGKLQTDSLGDVNDLETLRGESSWFRTGIDKISVKDAQLELGGIDGEL